MNYNLLSHKELAEIESGTILEDATHEGIRYLIMRGPASLTAYLGIPLDHPLIKGSYDDIDLSVSGGLTYGDVGDGVMRPSNLYWLGWDYAHCFDISFYDYEYGIRPESIGWTVPMVRDEIFTTIPELKKLMEAEEK